MSLSYTSPLRALGEQEAPTPILQLPDAALMARWSLQGGQVTGEFGEVSLESNLRPLLHPLALPFQPLL